MERSLEEIDMDNKRLFDVNVRKYCTDKNFSVYYPASINNPRNHAVMFVTEGYLERASELSNFFECLIFFQGNYNGF